MLLSCCYWYYHVCYCYYDELFYLIMFNCLCVLEVINSQNHCRNIISLNGLEPTIAKDCVSG